MVDVLPPEEDGVLFHQGDALEVLYSRPWRMVYGFVMCTHTANSGAASRPLKAALGLLLAAIAFFFAVWCCDCQGMILEHSRSIVGKFGVPPTQVVSPVRADPVFRHASPPLGENRGRTMRTLFPPFPPQR